MRRGRDKSHVTCSGERENFADGGRERGESCGTSDHGVSGAPHAHVLVFGGEEGLEGLAQPGLVRHLDHSECLVQPREREREEHERLTLPPAFSTLLL